MTMRADGETRFPHTPSTGGNPGFPTPLPIGGAWRPRHQLGNGETTWTYTILDFRFWIVDCHAGQHNA